MTSASHRCLLSAGALTLAFALAGCGERSDEGTAARADAPAARTAQAAREKLGESSQVASQGSRDASTSVMGAAADAREKAYSPPEGKADAKVDEKLTSMVLTGLKADKELNPLRIDVDTREGVVTLSGSVPTAAAKARASEIAQNVKNVKSVNNQLTVSAS